MDLAQSSSFALLFFRRRRLLCPCALSSPCQPFLPIINDTSYSPLDSRLNGSLYDGEGIVTLRELARKIYTRFNERLTYYDIFSRIFRKEQSHSRE